MSARAAAFHVALVASLAASLPACVVFEEPRRSSQSGPDTDGEELDAGADDDAAAALDGGIDAASGPDDASLLDAPEIDAATPDAGRDAAHVDAAIPRRPQLDACGFAAPVVLGTITDASLDEVSGMAMSRRHPNVFWVIEDSGSAPVVHAVNDRGRLLATYRVAGVAIDYEDIAIGPGPDSSVDYLYVADIGDNDGSRSTIVVYRAPEPEVSADQVRLTGMLDRVEPLPLTYPAGYRDNAEALFVDPATQDLYLVTKNGFSRPNELFRLAAPHTPAVARELELLGAVFAGDGTDIAITSADISPDGAWIAIRGLRAINVWSRAPGASIADTILGTLPCAAPVPAETKGESIAVGPAGFYTTTEGVSPPISFVSFTP